MQCNRQYCEYSRQYNEHLIYLAKARAVLFNEFLWASWLGAICALGCCGLPASKNTLYWHSCLGTTAEQTIQSQKKTTGRHGGYLHIQKITPMTFHQPCVWARLNVPGMVHITKKLDSEQNSLTIKMLLYCNMPGCEQDSLTEALTIRVGMEVQRMAKSTRRLRISGTHSGQPADWH